MIRPPPLPPEHAGEARTSKGCALALAWARKALSRAYVAACVAAWGLALFYMERMRK